MTNLQLFSPRFKAGLTLAFMLCTFAAFGQYPTQPNKIALGRQTTGDGLIFRTSGQPSWTPSTVFNAWMAIDTTTGNMWTYREGAWFLEVAGDLKVDYPKVINKSGVNILRGQVVMVDTVQLVQGDQVRIRPAIATMSNSQFVMGVATEDIANDASGYITWFGYVREVKEADIAQTGVTLDVGDILYISATQAGKYTDTEPAAPNVNSTMALVVRKPSANNMTLLVRPWLNEKLGDLRDVDLSGIANGQGISWDSVNRKFIPATFGSGSVTSIATNDGITGGTITTSGTIGLTGQALALHNIGGTGFFTRGAGGSIALRSIGAGTGISISDASGLSGNPTITNSAPDQTVVLTAGTGISTSGTYPNFTITNSAPDQTVSITGAGINSVTGTYPNFTITGTEVDGSTTNEGILGVGAGSANTAVINSNTSGANGLTINGGVGALVTETTSSNGGTINVLVDTANIVSKTFLTNQGYTSNAGTVTSVATGYGLDGGTITTTGTLSVDTLEIATPYDVSLKQDKLSGTGLVKSTSGTISYITDNSANWDAAYNDRITIATFSGSGTKTLSLSQQDGGAVTASFTDLQGVTSITAGVGLSGGTITTSGTIDADTTTVLASKTWVQTRGYLTSEVDGSVSNEGILGVGAGGDNTATITSNTSGANGVTVSGGVGVFISESTSTNGGTITARVDTANIVTKTFLSNQAYTSNTGTVTSIATNNGITGGTITTTGTIGLTGNALGLHQLASNGMLARTGAGAIAARTITAGTGISVSNGDGVSGNPTITNSAPDQTVSITGAGINSVSGSYPNFTITGTEVDGSTTNEGTLGVGAGGANTAIITSNTSGANGVTIAGGTNVTITESTSSNGGTITVNASGGDSGWFQFFNQYTTPTASKPMKFSGSDSLYIFANSISNNNYLSMSTAYLSDSIDVTAKRYDLLLDIDMSLVSSVARLADSTAALRAAFPTGTVTSIATNNGITGGTITSSGTIGLTGQALALHNLSTNGIIARTGAGTVAGRTITAGTGISVSNGDGVSGNPTITNSLPEATTARNINATGEGIYRAEVGDELQFKRLVAGSNITLTGADSTITIASTASGSIKGTGAANKVAIWASSDSLYQNSNLHWDNSNGRLGINNTSPSERLHIGGNILTERLIVNTSGQSSSITNYKPTNAIGENFYIGGGGSFSSAHPDTTFQASFNTGIGLNSLYSNTTGFSNTAIGGYALYLNTSGFANAGIGNGSLVSNTSGSENLAIANNALYSNTTGNQNTGIGTYSLYNNTTGNYNMSLGTYGLYNNTTGATNISIGPFALYSNTTASKNVGIGQGAMFFTNTGSNNTAIGADAGVYINSGANNTSMSNSVLIGQDTRPSANGNTNEIVIGYEARGQGSNTAIIGNSSITNTYLRGKVSVNTTASANTLDVEGGAAIGASYSGTSTAPTNGLLVEGETYIGKTTDGGAYRLQVSGAILTDSITISHSAQTAKISNFYPSGANGNNLFIGNNGGAALNSAGTSSSRLIGIGLNTLNKATTAFDNVVIGANAGQEITTSNQTTVIGVDAAKAVQTANQLTAVGNSALRDNTSGAQNTAVGAASMILTTTGSNNTAVGYYTLQHITGSDNVAIGSQAARFNNVGGFISSNANSIFVGSDARPSANGNTNEIVIGYQGRGKGSNTTTIGNTSTTRSYVLGTLVASKGAPVTRTTATYDMTGAAATFDPVNYIIANYAGTMTITLPTASSWTGRELTIKTVTANTVISNANNVVPIDDTVAGNAILPATDGAWALLVSDGTNWVIMQKG